MDAEETVRTYYDAIDDADYDRLAGVLRPEFTHYRPDRTLEGRGTFVEFMREGRPRTDTTHEIDAVYPTGPGVAVQGRLLDTAGNELFRFVDVFRLEDGELGRLETYTST